ncbi:MAG: acyl-CoA dehydrogenase family protein [Acidimicrobiia bacterium]|nr:acyl-CoA dehydrogenase family protein [Acidimicrobiia bacterium]
MDLADSPEEAAFRSDAKAFLDDHIHLVPTELGDSGGEWDQALAASKKWQRLLYENGWAAITWPTEHGGRGCGPVEQIIWNEECARARTPSSVNIVGIGMAGPALIAHGSAEQRERYLSRILSGEEIWCQLFSEPAAGSDLAAVATRAERDGDDWVVHGRKVWSSGAHYSRRAILLARTDSTVAKHKGMTFFVVDMDSPGVSTRPLRQLNGEVHFNEVLLDGVRIPDTDRVDAVGEGWRVAMTTILHERMALGGSINVFHMEDLLALARQRGNLSAHERDLIVRVFTLDRCLGYLNARVITKLGAGKVPTAEGSIAKLAMARQLTLAAEAAFALLGPRAVTEPGPWQDLFLIAPGVRIGGGTDEIQRNMLAERVLGLPREADESRKLPFREIRR